MHEIILKFIIFAYGATSLVDAIAYWPTIKDLWFHKKPSANSRSYQVWTLSAIVTFLYSLFVLPDVLFRVVSLVMLLLNVLILVLRLRLQTFKQQI
ncbi:hypothetical protein H6802_00780 [Candidatus Nomurabacteria bacterium]|uniref:Uncharacterized protein n=1 Tax=candidate division WWE3 bacterium TaxID=2053526 RepID=A0A955E036_UNCKA|nr:hypothetical protein [candidate division WWE3 bacterium]MCB9823479.1 hypothetical protein [Candidatus Nomurabacteria bacterium]MCB9827761.1 hypothetical protein [Candidatus Nomurabacteria bacterium]HXK52366.1 hypothetical protein [bacterium]